MAIIILDESGEKSLIYAPGDNCEWDQQTAFTAIAESKIMYTMPGDLEKYTVQAQYARSQNTWSPSTLSRILPVIKNSWQKY